MKRTNALILATTAVSLCMAGSVLIPLTAVSQGRGQAPGAGAPGGGAAGRGQGGQGRGQAAAANLPSEPTAVTLPTITGPVSGPGAIYESVQSLAPGKDLRNYRYEAREYFVTGMANGQPYKTRIVVRRPTNNNAVSGLVLVEAMHPSGSAHMFEYTSMYTMSSGHIAVEILTSGQAQIVEHNKERYGDLRISGGQTNEILAQVGALLRPKEANSPLSGLPIRKVVMAGTSATARVVADYLPAHMVYRTPDMQRIYDGFMPTSYGATVPQVDVPLIEVPTLHEVRGANITAREDGDQPGDQFRLYEFSGISHVDSRDNVRLMPNPCVNPTSQFPVQAFMSVALNHLLQWVDKGVVPPKADRIWKDRSEQNDGSSMALDEHKNPRGGIRNTYVDVPTAQYGVPNQGKSPVIPNPSAYVAAGGLQAANQMCNLSGYQIPKTKAELKQLYGSRQNYRTRVERRLAELEKAGWSLPVYREMILDDASKVEF